MSNVRLSNQAKEDLIRIYRYGLARFGQHQADTYFEELYGKFESIAQRPKSFESINHIKEGYRRCVCGANSIFFKESKNFVDIMAIVGRQDIGKILK